MVENLEVVDILTTHEQGPPGAQTFAPHSKKNSMEQEAMLFSFRDTLAANVKEKN